ncbi:MAG: argininosuccinate lyase [Firmicutes bacterium]|nr:argininosuccinate lyase [Bacillota bacterium]
MKLWKGRFAKEENTAANDFNSSTSFDSRMWKQDITGSMAHAAMLGKQGIITKAESEQIIAGLKTIYADIDAGTLTYEPEDEDIHMFVERVLTQRIGTVGKKLHTARSRNDQVALDFRMYQKELIGNIDGELTQLLAVLYKLAEENKETVLPGFTHLQKAQPVLLAHHLLAYYNMFTRDSQRFADCFKRTDYMPLGAGALAGTTYNTDRFFVQEQLGFENICTNSMDAVSDRDFALEFLSCASITMMHLSRLCEELILWCSPDFGFIEMDDSYSTGSSIMPQKKNPDMAELIRGKTGRVYGDLMGLLTVMKGLPLAYNKDMQEDKEPVFDAADTLIACLQMMIGMLSTLTVNVDKMAASTKSGFMNATDAADYLVSKGLAFRDCHEIIGKLVLHCIQTGRALEDLPLSELKQFSEVFEEDIYENIDIKTCIKAKKSYGSTSYESVKTQLSDIKAKMGY